MAGVSTRTVRHYHRVGLMPEPARTQGDYRRYASYDVVRLLRIRRLVELGLSLDEVGDALSASGPADLREILTDLDADLATREHRLRKRREAIAVALDRGDDLHLPEGVASMSADLRSAFGADPPAVEREQMVLEVADQVAGRQVDQVQDTYRQLLDDPELVARLSEANARFEQLAGLAPDDPAVDALAADAAKFGDAVAALLPAEVRAEESDPSAPDQLLAAVTAGMDAAQQRCMQLMFDAWRQAGS
ncbi:MAG: MerR family transcriptional regulator [Nocardioidaceae bacterium]